MSHTSSDILVRKCAGFDEFEGCVRLQTEVWGYDGRDTIPLREFIVIERIGGQIFGAFDLSLCRAQQGEAGGLIGFAMSMPAIDHGTAYLHSHMLAVLPAYRNTGIGRRLKLAQREEALSRGVRRMEWTFDPLELKNAYLNVTCLGAVVRSYTPNFYGVFSSRLQAGLPTDRLHAEWWMDSDRVIASLTCTAAPLPEIRETITVPGEIREWKATASRFHDAEAVQSRVRGEFLEAFAQGLIVVKFTRGKQDDNGSSEGDGVYHLAKWPVP